MLVKLVELRLRRISLRHYWIRPLRIVGSGMIPQRCTYT
jgi:hypothetical protein